MGLKRHEIIALCEAARELREALNDQWAAEQGEGPGLGAAPIDLEAAEERRAEAFEALYKAEYYVRKGLAEKAVEDEGKNPGS